MIFILINQFSLHYGVSKKKLLLQLHLATVEFLDAVQIITSSSVQTDQMVARVALTPTLIIEGTSDIMAVTSAPAGWCTLGLAALSLFNVVKPVVVASVQASHEITSLALVPCILLIK